MYSLLYCSYSLDGVLKSLLSKTPPISTGETLVLHRVDAVLQHAQNVKSLDDGVRQLHVLRKGFRRVVSARARVGGSETVPESRVVFALQINFGVPRRILLVNLRRLSNFAVQRHDFVVGLVAFQCDRGERFVVVRVDHEFGRRQQ